MRVGHCPLLLAASSSRPAPILLFHNHHHFNQHSHRSWRKSNQQLLLRNNDNVQSSFLRLHNSQQEEQSLEDVATAADSSSSSSSSSNVLLATSSSIAAAVNSDNDDNFFNVLSREEGNMSSNNSIIVENNSKITNASITNNTIRDGTLEIWGIPLQSILLLNLVAVIWGTQHAIIKSVIDNTPTKLSGIMQVVTTLPILQPFITAAATTAAGENNAVGAMLDTSTTIASSSSSSSSSTAAYFTLARFGLATLLSSPYTPGVRQIMDDIKESLFGSTSELQKTQYIEQKQSSIASTTQQQQLENLVSNSTVTTAWRYGFELGIYMFLGYAFQAIGLETTTASRSGFLLYLNVKLVPFFAHVLYGKSIATRSWLSALIAFIGTSLLALDNNGGGGSGILSTATITVGDLWSIAAAATSAIFILRMESASREVVKSSELNAATLWTVSLLSVLWTMTISIHDSNAFGSTAAAMVMVDGAATITTTITTFVTIFIQSIQQIYHETVLTITQHFIPLLYLSGITTALANYIQSKAQQNVSAERASIIYAMDPVYGAIFANLLLGETLGKVGLVGALLIVLAAVTNAMVDFGTNNAEAGGDHGDCDHKNDKGNS